MSGSSESIEDTHDSENGRELEDVSGREFKAVAVSESEMQDEFDERDGGRKQKWRSKDSGEEEEEEKDDNDPYKIAPMEIVYGNSPMTKNPFWLGNTIAFCYRKNNPLFTIGPHCKFIHSFSFLNWNRALLHMHERLCSYHLFPMFELCHFQSLHYPWLHWCTPPLPSSFLLSHVHNGKSWNSQ